MGYAFDSRRDGLRGYGAVCNGVQRDGTLRKPTHAVRALLLVVAIWFVLPTLASDEDVPNVALTPGDVFPNVSVDAICTPGYAGSVRHVTAIVRQQVFTAYGLTGNHTGYCDGPQGCELDHLISLELGGSNDPRNLWPESYDSQPWNAHVKDHLENTLHALVCSGKVSLTEA
jgi:hypothetical protein